MRVRPSLMALAFFLAMPLAFPLRTEDSGWALKLQREVDRAMGKLPGAIVVVDVTTRTVLAAHRMDLASSRLVAPGSTLKPFLLMALLETGKLDPKQQLICRRPLKIGSARLDCTHPAEVAQLDAAEAIAYSCNSYVAQVASRLNGTELVELLRRAGFDTPSGLIPQEARGRIALASSLEDLELEALGYHGIAVTPLELLEAYRRLALRKRQNDLGVDAPVFKGLEDSVTFGMAHAAFVEGMNIAGKTGTSVARNGPQTHGFFVGYAPAEKPEIAVVVFLSEGRGMDAAAVAQPVFSAFRKLGERP
jgi:cell division protein FtsI/penicillin-binding protein 2